MKEIIKEWQTKFGISHWDITTEKIDPKQVVYDGEEYFIGIAIDWDTLKGVILISLGSSRLNMTIFSQV